MMHFSFRPEWLARLVRPGKPSGRRSRRKSALTLPANRILFEQFEDRALPSANPIVQAVPVTAQEAQPLVNVPLATFTVPGAAPGDVMGAFINWGDGSSGAGTVTQNGSTFTVTGNHTYFFSGTVNVSITVGDLTQHTQSGITQQITVHNNVVPGGNADQRWIASALTTLLQRPVSQADINYWYGRFSGDLNDDRFTTLVVMIEQTPPFEFRQDTVNTDYESLLHRSADATGLNYFVNQLYLGVSGTTVKADIAASPEFWQTQAGGTNNGYVTALYENILKRSPDPGGAAFYEQQLAGGVSRMQVALEILRSTEAQTDSIDKIYEQYLGRAPDPAGLQMWLNDLTQQPPSVVTGTEGVIELIVSGDEFYNDAQA